MSIDDTEDIFRLRSDKRVNQFLDRPLQKTKSEAESFISKILKGFKEGKWWYWAIAIKPRKEFAGTICLWNFSSDGSSAEIGFELTPDFQGYGYMNEALKRVMEFGFVELSLDRVVAYTRITHKRSINLLSKNNFTRVAEKDLKDVLVCYELTKNSIHLN